MNDTFTLSTVSASANYTWSFGGYSTVASGSNLSGPMMVSWSNGGIQNINLTVSDNGCITHSATTITVDSANGEFTFSPLGNACLGQNVIVTAPNAGQSGAYSWNFGGATVVSGGGAGPYNLKWNSIGNKTISLKVSNSGCSDSITHSITIASDPVALAGRDTSVCSGITVQLGGAAVAGVSYAWTPATNLSNANIANPVFVENNPTVTPDTTHYMVVASLGGCTDTARVTTIVAPSPVITISALGATGFCAGDSVALAVNVPTAVHYLWSDGDTLGRTIVKTNGNYTVTATDANGCRMVSSPAQNVTVYVNPTLSLAVNGEHDESCPQANDGKLFVVASGGSGPYIYGWSTVPPQATDSAVNLAPGGYTVTMSDAHNCVDTAHYIILSATAISINIDSLFAPGCRGGMDGRAYIRVSGGLLPYSYTWIDSILGTPVGSAASLTAVGAGSYVVLVTDGKGCMADTSVDIAVSSNYFPIQVDSAFAPACAGGNNGRGYITITSLNSPFTYSWADSITGVVVSTNPALTGVSAGSYMVTVTDANHCVSDTSINVPASVLQMSLQIDSAVAPTCAGGRNGHAGVTPISGTAPYTYSWSDSITSVHISSNAVLNNLPSGSYTISVSDANGCISDTSVDIPASVFRIYAGIDSMINPSCQGNANGAIYASANGATVPVSYLWSNGASTAAITGLTADSFTVHITDANGCSADTMVVLIAPVTFSLTSPGIFQITTGSSQALSVTVNPAGTNYTYLWSPAATLSCSACAAPIATPTVNTTYTVMVSQGINGCKASTAVTVNVEALKHFYVPNAFSPNGDGINDTHQISYSGTVLYYEIRIYDRWGEMVYSSNDIDRGWDGSYLGAVALPGDYVYKLAITFGDGQTFQNKGTITLVR